MRTTGAAALIFALPLASCLAGCGQAPAKSTPPPAAIDACALLNPDDVGLYSGDVMGTLSSTIDDTVGRDPAQCTYSLAGTTPPRVIGLQVRQADSAERAASLHRAAESGLNSLAGGVTPIAGLGDAAFWVGGTLDQLHVLVGSQQLIFTVQIDKDPQAAARNLAGRALSRIRPTPAH
jgi:hypothetical protein